MIKPKKRDYKLHLDEILDNWWKDHQAGVAIRDVYKSNEATALAKKKLYEDRKKLCLIWMENGWEIPFWDTIGRKIASSIYTK